MSESQESTVVSNQDLAIQYFKEYLDNSTKFYSKDTVSAAARARKALSKLTKLAKVARKELQTRKLFLVAERATKREVKE